MSRKRGVAETPEYVAFARRAIRGLGKRLDAADPETFREVVGLVEEFEEILGEAMDAYVAKDRHLAPQQRTNTWTAIGAALGVSRQQAEQRWSRRGRERLRAAQARYRARQQGGSPAA
jgi:hypothetical protein